MSFISNNVSSSQSVTISEEVKKVAKSRGFDENGSYRFEPLKQGRESGTINNGRVVGMFEENSTQNIKLKKEDFDPISWKRICAAMGYKYNDSNEFKSFSIPKGVEVSVEVSMDTPRDKFGL